MKFYFEKILKDLDFVKDYYLLDEINMEKNNNNTSNDNTNIKKRKYFFEKFYLFYQDALVKLFY